MKPVDKTSEKEKQAEESKDDPRPEWAAEDREIEGRKPDLEEIEEDPSGTE